MRINPISSTFAYQKNNNKQNLQIANNNSSSYMTQNTSPSFEGFFRKSSKAEITAKQVMKKIKEKWYSSHEKVQRSWESSINEIKENTTNEIAPLINQLVDMASPRGKEANKYLEYFSDFSNDLNHIKSLSATLKYFPNSKNIMQEVASEKIIDKPRFSLFEMNYDIFGIKYNKTDAENEFIGKLIKAKNSDGSPTYNSNLIYKALKQKDDEILAQSGQKVLF